MLYDSLTLNIIVHKYGLSFRKSIMTHPKAIAAAKNLGLDLVEYKNFLLELETSFLELSNDAKNELMKNNGTGASEIIHSIKGSVGSLGLLETHSFCQIIEKEYKKGVNEKSMVLFEEFIRIYTKEFNEIKQDL